MVGAAISLAICSACFFAIPYTKNINVYLFIQALVGLGDTGLDVATCAEMIDLWRTNAHRCNSCLQLIYLFAGLGWTISPQIARPFLAPILNDTSSNGDGIGTYGPSRIEIPYMIFGSFATISAFIQLIVYFKYYRFASTTVKTVVAKEAELTRTLYWLMLALGAALFCFFIGVLDNVRTFSVTYAFSAEHHKDLCTYMATTMNGIMTATRAACIFLAAKISATSMLCADIVLISIGNLLPLVLGFSDTVLWASFVFSALGLSSIVGSMSSLMERKMTVGNFEFGVLWFGAGIASAITPVLLGSHIQKSPSVFNYINLFGLAMCTIILISLNFIQRCFERQVAVTRV